MYSFALVEIKVSFNMELLQDFVSLVIKSDQDEHLQFVATDYVDRVRGISYNSFFTKYLFCNKPCLLFIDIENWKSKQEWVNENGKPNYEFLSKEFGSAVVPVADCGIKDYNAQLKTSMIFSKYIEFWQELNKEEHANVPSLYLKDWHFNRDYPNYIAYETPIFFRSDWLNEFCKSEQDDYQFVYMGPKGTWTPLHVDVFGSYSWSINICGRKRWLLFPPGNEKFLQDEFKQLIYTVENVDLRKQNVQYLDIIQEAGEAIFVPSGWYHQVWNLEDTISINHNWFNGCNVSYIWKCLTTAAADVEREILDCKNDDDFQTQWQLVLKVHHGMNYLNFLEILQFIFNSRVKKIQNQVCAKNFWHYIFDIVCIKNVCSKMMNINSIFSFEDLKNLYDSITAFLDENNKSCA